MPSEAYIGVNNSPKKIKEMYVGVNGVPKKVKEAYIGVSGVPKLFYKSGISHYKGKFPENATRT